VADIRKPTAEGWWARHKAGKVAFYYVHRFDDGQLAVWLDDAEDFLHIELLATWHGPIALPWGADDSTRK
jgi:hypothetical protein